MVKNEKIARAIFAKCLQLQKGECCLIISDENRRAFAQMLFTSIHKYGCNPVLAEVMSPKRYGDEPPKALIEAMRHADAVILTTEFPLIHRQVRVTGFKTRILTISTIDTNTIERLISADYSKIKERTQKMADIFTIGKRLTITTPAGTNLTMSIANVKGKVNSGVATDKGQFSSLPGGEAYLSPVSGSAQGKVVIDRSLDFIGLLNEPLTLSVKDGVIVKISGNKEAQNFRRIIKPYGQNARKLIGVGVGTNDRAKPGLSVGEDKKSIGTVHITIGNNTFYDKTRRLPARIDGVLQNASLSIDGRQIIKHGEIPIFHP
ncbi:aminopeptidase [candidate division KSB1 bacterium]|nr:aminopeptidase [candidate division KSB1 bacterium]